MSRTDIDPSSSTVTNDDTLATADVVKVQVIQNSYQMKDYHPFDFLYNCTFAYDSPIFDVIVIN